MHIYVYTDIHNMYVYMYVYIHIYIYMYIHVWVCMGFSEEYALCPGSLNFLVLVLVPDLF